MSDRKMRLETSGRVGLSEQRRIRKSTTGRGAKRHAVSAGRRMNMQLEGRLLLQCWMEEGCEDSYSEGDSTGCAARAASLDEDEAWATCSDCDCVGGKHLFSLFQLVASRPLCLTCEAHKAARSATGKAATRAHQLTLQQRRTSKANRKAMSVFAEIRKDFLHQHADELLGSALKITSISVAPMHPEVVSTFVTPFATMLPAARPPLRMLFHGTEERNLQSIFQRGLLIGGSGGIAVRNGAARGLGVYTGTTPHTSLYYCRRSRKMLVCALWETRGAAEDYHEMVIVRKEERIVPMFVVMFEATPPATGKVSNSPALLDDCL